ncbi:MAG: acyl-CoA dehydrogenase family protein [Planctomycetaceae bacterium]
MPFQGVDLYNLDDLLSPEDLELRTKVRDWVERRYLPIVRHHFAQGTFPLELVRELAPLGAFGGSIAGYGCAGLTALQYGLVMQELERGDSGLRTFAWVLGALAMNAIHMFGSEDQKRRWLPAMAQAQKLGCFGLTEPDHGSNPGGMTTRARKTDRGYVLNGQKMWIGLGTEADVAVVWAKVDGLTGVVAESAAAVRGFLVERGLPGFSAELIEGKLSLRAANTSRLAFTDCELPADAILPASQGLKSPLLCLNHARYGIAWGVLGAAMACLEEAREYAGRRIQFGRPLAAFQLVQRKLSLMATELTKAQLLAYRLAQLKDAGRATHWQISIAKRNNVEMALEIARTARDILGGVGILDEHQCFRHMCNLESVKTYEGTDDMHLLILGEKLTGIAAFA